MLQYKSIIVQHVLHALQHIRSRLQHMIHMLQYVTCVTKVKLHPLKFQRTQQQKYTKTMTCWVLQNYQKITQFNYYKKS